jgi:hypothetical protein
MSTHYHSTEKERIALKVWLSHFRVWCHFLHSVGYPVTTQSRRNHPELRQQLCAIHLWGGKAKPEFWGAQRTQNQAKFVGG